jgi:RNA polymerase sigma factor for flagellar operon FliA
MSALDEHTIAIGEDEASLWRAHKTDGVLAAREKLFALHTRFARNIARRHHRERSRGDLDMTELFQLAYAGLLEALDRFDPTQGVPFRAFAAHRISGSISDGIAKMSEVHEQLSWHSRCRRERLRSLSPEDTRDLKTSEAMERAAEIAVGLALGFMLEGTGFVANEADPAQSYSSRDTAYDSVAWNEMIDDLRAELAMLPEREQTILMQHYLNGMSFEQVASLFGISKGRVSQLHRVSLLSLRKRMIARGHFRLER